MPPPVSHKTKISAATSHIKSEVTRAPNKDAQVRVGHKDCQKNRSILDTLAQNAVGHASGAGNSNTQNPKFTVGSSFRRPINNVSAGKSPCTRPFNAAVIINPSEKAIRQAREAGFQIEGTSLQINALMEQCIFLGLRFREKQAQQILCATQRIVLGKFTSDELSTAIGIAQKIPELYIESFMTALAKLTGQEQSTEQRIKIAQTIRNLNWEKSEELFFAADHLCTRADLKLVSQQYAVLLAGISQISDKPEQLDGKLELANMAVDDVHVLIEALLAANPHRWLQIIDDSIETATAGFAHVRYAVPDSDSDLESDSDYL